MRKDAVVNRRCGEQKWCCFCSQPGHYSDKCKELAKLQEIEGKLKLPVNVPKDR